MKTRVSVLAVSLALGLTMAQTTPANPQPQDPQEKTAPTDSKAKNQKDMKGGSMSAASTPAEMKTATFKGVLVDMSCASHASSSTGTSPADSGAAPAPDQKNSANRAASDSGSSCPVSASTSEFGMKMDDGRTVRFDLVGNQRAQDAVKNDKGWNKDISANKPIHAKISGVLNGDKLIVSSIH